MHFCHSGHLRILIATRHIYRGADPRMGRSENEIIFRAALATNLCTISSEMVLSDIVSQLPPYIR